MTEVDDLPDLIVDANIDSALADFELPEDLGFGRVLVPVMYRCDSLMGHGNQGILAH